MAEFVLSLGCQTVPPYAILALLLPTQGGFYSFIISVVHLGFSHHASLIVFFSIGVLFLQ